MATGTFTATLSGTLTQTSFTSSYEVVEGTLAASAGTDTYATGGLVCSFVGFDSIKSSSVPIKVDIWSGPAAGTSPSGWIYQWCYGTTMANGKVAIFGSAGSAAALAEYGNGSALTTVATDVIRFRAWFPRL